MICLPLPTAIEAGVAGQISSTFSYVLFFTVYSTILSSTCNLWCHQRPYSRRRVICRSGHVRSNCHRPTRARQRQFILSPFRRSLIMVFASLGPHEKEAFFGLLDEFSLSHCLHSINKGLTAQLRDLDTSNLALTSCLRSQDRRGVLQAAQEATPRPP